MPDRTLIRAFQEGDELAFVSLYNRYKDSVFSFCWKMLSDRDLALDVMQETFVRVYENRDRLLSTASFKSWLFTIARNQCLNQISRGRRHVSYEGLTVPPTSADTGDTPFTQLEKNERVLLVNEYLLRLSPAYREVIVLREYQNLTYEEIAAVTRSTVSAVKSRLFKARRKLGAYLAPILRPDHVSAERRVRGAIQIRESGAGR
jgi:RNA polymerase sigma-70 factor (ECF subfamily)